MSKTEKRGSSGRKAGRTVAFQILFGLGMVPPENSGSLDTAFEEALFVLSGDENNDLPKGKNEAFARELVQGVWDNLEDLDEIIGRHSQHWKVGRIAKVELTILRLALFEMVYRPDIPLKVAINEAIELSKRFGDGRSRNFINGILDAVAKAVDSGKFEMKKSF